MSFLAALEKGQRVKQQCSSSAVTCHGECGAQPEYGIEKHNIFSTSALKHVSFCSYLKRFELGIDP